MQISVFKRAHLMKAAFIYSIKIPDQILAFAFKSVLPYGSYYTQLQYLNSTFIVLLNFFLSWKSQYHRAW